MPIYRKNAEKYIHRLCNQFLSLYPGCTVGFDRKSNAGNACTRPVGSEHFDIRIGVADLFPVDKNGCPTTKYVDAMPYMKAAEALVHEFSHVGQMLYSKDPVIRLANTVWQYNRDLYQDCYVSDVREIDAERDGFWGLRSHLCDVFGEKHGCNMFDKYVQYDTQGFCGYLIASLGKPCRTEWDFFDMIDSARSEALRQPFWYHDRESYDQGIHSGDMVLRVLANKKWDGAENAISNSCTYEQSCRRILALCAQEDPNVLHGLEDLKVSLESEFPAEFLDGVRRRQRGVAKGPANEYQEMRKGILNDMCCGHPVTRCRIALLDAKPSESGSRVSIRAVQACDLSGKNCPVTANPDLASFRYVQSDCMRETEHYVLYPKEDYDAMMGVANHAGNCPVFYGNLVSCEFSGGTYMRVDPQSVLPSKIPFSLLTHNQHVDEARQDARESVRCMLSGAGHAVLQLGPEHDLSDTRGDDFGPSL